MNVKEKEINDRRQRVVSEIFHARFKTAVSIYPRLAAREELQCKGLAARNA